MKILILAPFCSLPGEPYFNRFLYLAEILSKRHEVTLLTSRFRHFDKSFRKDLAEQSSFKIELIDESGYVKNVSIARLRSHSEFIKNFINWFTSSRRGADYDLVYSAYPLIATNIALGKLKRDYNFKLVIDVQDVWPEAFAAVVPQLDFLPPALIPFSWRANKAYRAADALVAVSETYLNRAQLANPSAPGLVTYIGSDSDFIDSVEAEKWPEPGVNFLYIGTLSHSYDIETIVKGMAKFKLQGEKYYLHILGNGPDAEYLKKIAPENVKFHGFVPYARMVALAKGSDFFINPIKGSAKQSITNKLSDYILIGKRVVTSQTNPEARQLLARAGAIQYRAGDVPSFMAAASQAANESVPQERLESSVHKSFARKHAYQKLADFIEGLQ